MADVLSLEELVHLSLGDPEAGAVNFNVLKTLLLQMLKAMNLYNYKPIMSDHDERAIKEALLTTSSTTPTSTKPHVKIDEDESSSQIDERDDTNQKIKQKLRRKARDRSSDRLTALEEKVTRFESQLSALNQMPSNSKLIDRTKEASKSRSDDDHTSNKPGSHGPILEVWQYTQMEKRIESAENGIARVASLLQDLIADMSDLKESHETMKKTTDDIKKQQEDLKDTVDKINAEKDEWARKSDIENLEEKIRNLQNLLASLGDRIEDLSKANNDLVPMPDLTGFVTWDRLEDALRGIRESLEKSTNDAAAALASVKDARRPIQVVERQSQTSAKQRATSGQGRRSPSSETVGLPSENLSDILEKLGTLNDRHEQLRALVEELEQRKLNHDEFDDFKNQFNNLLNRVTALEHSLADVSSKRTIDSSSSQPIREIIREVPLKSQIDPTADISDFRTALKYLREDLDRLKQIIQDLISKGNLSSQDIDALKKLIEQLERTKADKTTMDDELDKKADKRDVENRVTRKDFSAACNELSQALNDYIQKFNVHDDKQKQDLEKMNHDIEGKLDRADFEALKDHLDKQMKKLKKWVIEQLQSQRHVHVMTEDEAAGLRKQLIRFHCISCDRPIDMQPHPQQPSLPANQGMRPIQSPRPYTTYELDQIRQYQRNQQFSNELGGGITDVYATVRQCGGSHTMTLPFKRQTKVQPAIPEEQSLIKSEIDLKGQDGIIYKGRIDVSNLPAVDMQKKTSVVLLAQPPQKIRVGPPPKSAPSQGRHQSFVNDDQETNGISATIPNQEPTLSHNDSTQM